MKYHLLDHAADIGLVISAADLPTLFADAVHALFDVIAEVRLPADGKLPTLAVHVAGEDWPDLMVNWLREALYQWAGEERLIRKARILSIGEYRLAARLSYEPFDAERHIVLREIKAVTYHQIRVAPMPEGWEARVVFDV